jgi:hypothetical protein
MNFNRISEKIKYFLLGILLTISLLLLIGAYGNSPGRFQVSAWSGSGTGYGTFVVDTATGETKMAFLNTGIAKENNL